MGRNYLQIEKYQRTYLSFKFFILVRNFIMCFKVKTQSNVKSLGKMYLISIYNSLYYKNNRKERNEKKIFDQCVR